MAGKISVAILEDHQIVIDGYRLHLQNAPNFRIAGIAHNYAEWEPILAADPPDCALMDVKVPIAPGDSRPYPILSVMPDLVQTYTETAFLIISAVAEPTLIQKVMEAGAAGYILKDDNALFGDLKTVLTTVTAGRGVYLSPQARQLFYERLPDGAGVDLSPRQMEALTICAAHPDISNKDLARQMSIANSTARTLLSQAYARLGVSSRAAAIEKARQLGLIPR